MALDLSRLGNRSFISQAGIAEVLQAVAETGKVPTAASKSTVKRRRDAAVDLETPYGKLLCHFDLPLEDGQVVSLPYCNPAAFLYHSSRNFPRMQSLLDTAQRNKPNSMASKWQLILYMDEVSPGNQLKVTNRRKLQAIYYAIKQYGGLQLTQEHAWTVLTAVRTETVNKIRGGMSRLFGECIKLFFQDGGHMGKGISLQVGGEPQFCCFELCGVLADESALKQAFECKGASGRMLCMMCQTTCHKRLAPSPLPPRYVLHTEHNSDNFTLSTDQSVWAIVDHLQHQAALPGLSKKKFADEEVRLGWNYCPDGALLDIPLREHLRPVSVACYDSMHVYLVAGIWHRETGLLMNCLQSNGFRQVALHEFSTAFVWPKVDGGKSCSARVVFQKKKETDSEFKCSSSDALAIYPVLRSYLQNMIRDPPHELQLAINSYYLCCDVLDALKPAAVGAITPAELKSKIEAHLKYFKARCCVTCSCNNISLGLGVYV